ncbi:MAG: vitamin K epoxide reductase family protein [Bacteroidota bacterium]
MNEQPYNIIKMLVDSNRIRLNEAELKLQLLSHPSYPSLHSLTGVLKHFKINNLAIRLPTNQAVLSQLPAYFVASIQTELGEDLVFIEKQKKGITVHYNLKKTRQVTEDAFLEMWKGVILAIEKDEHVKETKPSAFTRFIKWPMYTLGGVLLFVFIFLNASWLAGAHFFLSILGLILSVMIVQHELGLQSSFAQQFCNLSPHTSCDAVLDSAGALLFGRVKLSDLCVLTFSTFCGYGLLLFISGMWSNSLLSILNVLALPFIVYSIYYQYQVVKKWCPLCLGIATVLLLQAGLVLVNGFSLATFSFHWTSALFLLMSTIVAVAIWDFLKPILSKKTSLEKLEVEHHRFKRKFSIFKALYQQQDLLSPATSIPGEIIMGNENAALELILVTSPSCYYCKGAHSDIVKLLAQFGEKIKVTLRFYVNPNNQNGDTFRIVSNLFDIYNTEGASACQSALDEVYKMEANLQTCLPNRTLRRSYDQVLSQQFNWCVENEIHFTPALVLNGRLFPMDYSRNELVYFVDDLVEWFEKEKQNNPLQLRAS